MLFKSYNSLEAPVMALKPFSWHSADYGVYQSSGTVATIINRARSQAGENFSLSQVTAASQPTIESDTAFGTSGVGV